VKLGTHIITNEKAAIKILDKAMIKDSSDIDRVNREIKIMKLLRHPNVVQLFDVKYYIFLNFDRSSRIANTCI
jgi:serine/threonine protein kinase